MIQKLPFQVDYQAIERNPDPYIEAIFASLSSEFLILPKGQGFLEYPTFEEGYQQLKLGTKGFSDLTWTLVFNIVIDHPVALIVLRTMLGFTPPELAYLATQRTDEEVTQNYARSLDRAIRLDPKKKLSLSATTRPRVQALVKTALVLLEEGAKNVGEEEIYRLDKADTTEGVLSIRSAASLGVPYAMLLYERYLGRPFAAHRDSVSGLVGDELEVLIEDELVSFGISYRKTKRAEKIKGFDQAPDFIIPDEYNPQVVIEAKITEDDGTARDKVTRIQHLASLSERGSYETKRSFQVIACIGGRGFGVRREDMKKLLFATQGKVFTRRQIDKLVRYSDLQNFVARESS